MLKALCKVRLAAFGAYYTGASRSRKKQSALQKLGFAVLMVYCLFAFGMMFYTSFSMLAGVYASAGLAWLYFAMYAIMAFALMVFGSVFTAKAQLFEAKDNELLLSMPIPPRDILASRMLALMGMNVLLELVVAVPALIAWLRAASMSVLGACAFVLMLLALPCLAMAVTSFLAWLLSLLSSKIRKKALVTTIGSMVFLGIYFAVVFRMNQYLTQLAQNGAAIAGALAGAAPLVWLGRAMAGEGAGNLLLALAVTVVPFILMYVILSRSFLSIVTTKRGLAKIRYQEKMLKTASADAALLQREFRRLGASASYLLNSGMGVLFLLAAAVALIIKRDAIYASLTQFSELYGTAPILFVLAIGGMTSMTLFTASSVSLEGKNLWILQSMPVSGVQVLRAKLRMANLLTLPAVVIASLACAVITEQWPLVLAASVLFAWFANLFGLREGIVHAKLDWTNEAQAVKQGWAVMLTMLGGWAIMLASGILWFALIDRITPEMFLLGFCAVIFILDVLLLRWLKRKGAERFSHLS